MSLNIDSETVNKYVADAVLNSAIGEALKKQIEETLEKITSGKDNPVQPVIDNHVSNALYQLLHQEYAALIKTRIAARLTDEVLDEIINAAFEAWMDKMMPKKKGY